jgi:enoyl-CoA hydratase/carnithine racemase
MRVTPRRGDIVVNSLIRESRSGKVGTLVLDQPARLNVLNTPLVRAATQALAELGADERLSVIVLTGAGRAFVAGADIREMREFSADEAREFITHLHGLFATVRGLDQIVIAAVNGPALGAGCELAAACDLRVAAEDATFGMPEVRVGIPSVIEAALLVPLIGLSRAAEWVYTGDVVSAADAERQGFVNRLAPAGGALAAALALAERLGEYSPAALRLQKSLVRRWYYDETMDRAVKLGIDHLAQAFRGPDPREAMTAFLEKREPRFDRE